MLHCILLQLQAQYVLFQKCLFLHLFFLSLLRPYEA